MANKIIVGTIRNLSNTPTDTLRGGGASTVEFSDGQTAMVGPDASGGNAYGQVLADLQTIGAPAYVEADSETNAIRVLLIPLEGEVSGLKRLPDGDVEVELEPSSAKHFLRASNLSYGPFIETLQSAQAKATPVLVTETPDSHEIIDVRTAPRGDQEPNPPQPATPSVAPAVVEELFLDLTAVTPHRANELFDRAVAPAIVDALLLGLPPVTQLEAHELFVRANAQTCVPAAIYPPCIPFLYPDDGCWARAQEMCNIFLQLGVTPGKIWNYGNLQVNTRNSPQCEVSWVYHVAPILHVTNGGAIGIRVIDPSLFRAPVPLSEWIHKQGDPTATQAASNASVFYLSPKGKSQFDPTGSKTSKALTLYRLQFKLRCASSAGPPPYIGCP
ncbi:MAG: protein-glutamine glutaminase family protein [Candidatus Korobacteraceae bacterium]